MREELGARPDAVVACVGGGSERQSGCSRRSWRDEARSALYGVEAAGRQASDTGQHAATLTRGHASASSTARAVMRARGRERGRSWRRTR